MVFRKYPNLVSGLKFGTALIQSNLERGDQAPFIYKILLDSGSE